MVSGTPAFPTSSQAQSAAAPPAYTAKSVSSGSITRLCLIILLLNCSAAIYHSRHDPWSVAFVATSFADLALLFHLIRRFEAEPQGSPARELIKAGIWVLASILTGMFSYKVASLMPLAAAAVVVWGMGAGTVIAGFCMLFLCGESAEGSSDDEALKAAEDGAHNQLPRKNSFGVPDLHKPILSSLWQ